MPHILPKNVIALLVIELTKGCALSLVECGDAWNVRVPLSIAVRGQGQIEEAMNKSGLAFPLIIKPLHDDGRASSHDLAVAWDLAAARECVAESGGVLQEFLEHDGLVYKVNLTFQTLRSSGLQTMF